MARVTDITREEVHGLVQEARNTGKSEKNHVKTQLTSRYPGIENATIRINGRVYNVLDYLAEDTESYAS